MHERIFVGFDELNPGVFRSGGVKFGRKPEFSGCDPGQIEAELNSLERFFAVHPFADGNGRVARIYLTKLCQETGRWSFRLKRIDDGNHEKRRRYDRALTCAHEACGRRPTEGEPKLRNPRNPVRGIERWLDGRLEEIEQDLSEEPP